MSQVALSSLNQAYLFQLWFGLGGNSDLVARHTGVDRTVIDALAHDYQWARLAGGKLGMADKKAEQEINRAVSYAQGCRLQQVLDKVLAEIERDPERLTKALFATTEDGRPAITAKPLVELAKALETAHNIRYRALGDKVAEQADTAGNESDRIKTLSLTVVNAMNNAVAMQPTDPVIVLDSLDPNK